MDISERISMLRGKIPREEFSEGTGVSGQTLYKYEKKLSTPTIEFVDLLCKKFKISHRWLITGDGPMRLEEDQPVSTSQQRQSQPSEITASIPCARCERLEEELTEERRERRELSAELREVNAELRRLARENKELAIENAELRKEKPEENLTISKLRKRKIEGTLSPLDEQQNIPPSERAQPRT